MIATTGIAPNILTAMITPAEYQKVRETIGTHREVAKMLGVDIRTVQRRERAEIALTFEATRALFCLSAINYVRNLLASDIKDNNIRYKLDNLVSLLEAH